MPVEMRGDERDGASAALRAVTSRRLGANLSRRPGVYSNARDSDPAGRDMRVCMAPSEPETHGSIVVGVAPGEVETNAARVGPRRGSSVAARFLGDEVNWNDVPGRCRVPP